MDSLSELFKKYKAQPLAGMLPAAVLSDKDRLLDLSRELQRAGFILLDVVGIDYLAHPEHHPKRFAVVYNLYRIANNERMFLRVYLDLNEEIPSLYNVWKSANYLEREVYDLVGVVFINHPNLRKVLTPEDLDGHPLRKDFPLGESPTLFNEGRFLDPAAFRAGLNGQNTGLTGWVGGERKGEQNAPSYPPTVDVFERNYSKGGEK